MQLNSIHVRMTSCFGAVFLLIGLVLTAYVDWEASEALTEASGKSLLDLGNSSALLIARTMAEREREIVLLSKSHLLTQTDLNDAAMQMWLDQIKKSYQYYAWLGLVAPDGTVLAASDGLLLQQNVSKRPWFQQGLQRTFVGDVHEAVLLANLLGRPLNNEPLRFIDFSAPVYGADQNLRAVIASHVHWSWISDVLASSLDVEAESTGVEAFILGEDGHWIHPQQHIGKLKVPVDLPAAGKFSLAHWGDEGLFLTSRVSILANTSNELGWQLVLRQPIAQALLPLTALQQKLAVIGFVTMMIGMLLAYRLAFQFSRPVAQLVQSAKKIVSGQEDVQFCGQSSLHEVQQLNLALTQMMENLAEKRRALLVANSTLEQQVQMRTTDLLLANETLQALARQDPLTGIHNRRAADERLQAEFLRMKRGENGYSILLMDIDHFKKINDSYGHEVGDDVLKFVAQRLQNTMRATDFIARVGGEEFMVILPQTDESGAKGFAEKLCADVAACKVPIVGKVTISIGGALARPLDPEAEIAVRGADAAMYQAKQAGRNRVMFTV